ncbi:MAG: DUF2249 domain-containing protein [Myxococcales bacterium]|nr:DUF2249 domain-containing protein [Myxococcales bacterium]
MTRREKTQRRREQIVEAALALLGETTLEQLTTRQIAAELDISQPALFRHFRSREAIVLAVMDHVRDQLADLAQRVLAAHDEPVAALGALARALLDHVSEHPGLPRMLFSPPPPGALRDALSGLVASQVALVAELVRQGQQRGVMSRALEPSRAARAFVGLLQAAVLHAQLAGQMRGLGGEAEPLVALWLDGVCARGRSEAPSRGAACEDAPAPQPAPALPRAPLSALDVRPSIAAGHDPLEQILARLAPLEPGDVLVLTAPFRPAPLLTLLEKRGCGVSARRLGADNAWSVDIVVGAASAIEDLVDLEPPEPLQRVLEASARLAPRAVYLARLPRVPRLLLPHLRERRLAFQLHEYADGLALLRVSRP